MAVEDLQSQSRTVGPSKPRLLGLLGPGLITGASDDDPSGIATYSQAGAQLGFAISWTLLFSYPLMAVIQEISGRIGRVTGRGIAGNIRNHYPNWLLQSIVLLLFAANTIRIHGSIYFPDVRGNPGQPMQGVNVVARLVDPNTGQPSRRYVATAVSGFLFRGHAGNHVSGFGVTQRFDELVGRHIDTSLARASWKADACAPTATTRRSRRCAEERLRVCALRGRNNGAPERWRGSSRPTRPRPASSISPSRRLR